MGFRETLTERCGLIAGIVLCMFLIWARMGAVTEVADYCGIQDEEYIYRGALRALDGPDMHPWRLIYPSLPIYMTAAAIKVGTMVEGYSKPRAGPLFRVPVNKGEPYEPANIVRYSRFLFAFLGSALFVLVALIAGRVLGDYSWAWVAPGILAFSSLVQHQAVTNQNVDVCAAFFASLTLLALLFGWSSNSYWQKALVPGVLSGLTVASKYNSGLILVSCVLAIYLAPGVTARFKKAVLLGVAAAVAFLLAVPYSVLDFQRFYGDVMYQVVHYRRGHPGYDGSAGLPQFLFYLVALYKEYGPIVCILSLVGIAYGFRVRPRETVVVLVFPLLMLLHMSTNRVHFLRTVLPVFVLLPVFAALGTAGVATAVGRLPRGTRWRRLVVSVSTVALVTGVIVTSDATIWADKNVEPDTREQAAAWILSNAPPGTKVYVASDLWFPKGRLDPLPVVILPAELPESDMRSIHVSGSTPTLLVLPKFGRPRLPRKLRNQVAKRDAFMERHADRMREANKRISRLIKRTGARLAIKWDGRRASLSATSGARSTSTLRPYIAIYLID